MTNRRLSASCRRPGHWYMYLIGLLVSIAVWCSLSGCGGSKPISVSITASSATVDGTDTVTVTATITHDRNAAGVTWGATGGGTLSNQTTTSATFTAPAATTSAQTITITATSKADTRKAATTTITVPAAPSITTSSLVSGSVGTAYTMTLAGSGGIPPYSWSITNGTLPAGLTLASAGTISGTPVASGVGTASLTFKITDSGKSTALTATKQLSLTVAAAPAITFTTGSSLSSGTQNVAYAATVVATGGAGKLTYSLSSGALPTGLTMSSAGAITGMPTVVDTFNFVVLAADAFGDSATQSFSIKINYPAIVIITPTALPTAYVGSNYSQTLAASGGTGTGYAWAVANGSSLPAGLSLSAGGILNGKPTTAAISTFGITVTDSAGNATTATFSLTIKAGVSITTGTTLPTAYAGSNYSQTLAATGGSGGGYTWTVANGSALPAWLSLSSGGVLSGKPNATGTSTFSITVTDSASNTSTAMFSLTVNAGVSITSSTTLPSGYQNAAYAPVTLAATGGTGTGYTWTWLAASGSSLPAGLTLSTAGVISGTPTAAGNFSIAITVTDSASNTASATFSLTVQAALSITTPTTLPSGLVNKAYSQTFAAAGGSGTGYTWAVTAGAASLSAVNLSLSTGGVLSGTPAATGTASFTAQVTDSALHTASANFSVAINASLNITTTSPLPTGYIGSNYSQTFAASGGTGTGYTWAVASGSTLPAGLTLSTAGVLSGKPTTAGTPGFSITVTDSASNTATAPFTMTVSAGISITTGTTLPAGYQNAVYSAVTMGATGGTGTGYSWMWAAAGGSSLPAGLSISTSGVISGTPTAAGTYNVVITVTDSASNTASGTFTLVVEAIIQITTSTTLPTGTVGVAYSQTLAATGGNGNYTWSVTSGGSTLTAVGLSLSSSGVVSGTPTAGGTASFTTQVADSASHTASANFTLTVSANSAITGQILLNNTCGNVSSLPTFSVTITNVGGTAFTQTVSTDSSGNFTFTAVPNGNYTITPSIAGPTSMFYPAKQNVTVNGNLTGQIFNATLGYTVSGTVSYAGSKTGQIYIDLVCSGTGAVGTSIASAGAFTIHGASPGTYVLHAWMDPSTLGEGAPNTSDPSGSTSGVTVSTANVTGQAVTMTDPTGLTIGNPPTLKAVAPENSGAVVSFGAGSVSSNGVENYTLYTVQWAASATGFSSSNQAGFKAVGLNDQVWILRNGNNNMTGTLTNGTAYYFRVMAANSTGSSTAWGYWAGSGVSCVTSACAIPVTIGAATGGNAVSGTIYIPSSVTVKSGAVLYAGLYDSDTYTAYAYVITSPTNSSAGNAFSVNVPTGSNYSLFGVLDQNNDGLIDAGDVNNVTIGGGTPLKVTGSLTGQNVTLPVANSATLTLTGYSQMTTSLGTSSSYGISVNVAEGNKLPVAVTLTGGPNFLSPVDISNYCQGCRHMKFGLYYNISSDIPSVGDTYTFTVKYSDGTSESNVVSQVAGWNGGTSVAGPSNLVTSMLPAGNTGPGSGTRSQPTFSWTDPSTDSSDLFDFSLYNYNNGSLIWSIPNQISNGNGFSNSITSIVWGVDPTGGGSTPSVGSLTSGTTYYWAIEVQDNIGNEAQTFMYYVP